MTTLTDRPDLERVSATPDGAALVQRLHDANGAAIFALFSLNNEPLKRVTAAANAAFDAGQAIIDREQALCDALAATRKELAARLTSFTCSHCGTTWRDTEATR